MTILRNILTLQFIKVFVFIVNTFTIQKAFLTVYS